MFGNVTNYRIVKSNSFLAARVERTKNFRCVACDVNTTVSTLSLSRRHFCVPWSLSILLPLYLSLSPPPPPFNALSFSFQTSLLFLAVTFRLFLFTSIRISVYLSCYSCHSVIAPCLPLNDFPPFSQIHALSLFLAFPHRIRLLPLLFSSSKIISVFSWFHGVLSVSFVLARYIFRFSTPWLSVLFSTTIREPTCPCLPREAWLSRSLATHFRVGHRRRPAQKDTRSIARTYTYTSQQPPCYVCVENHVYACIYSYVQHESIRTHRACPIRQCGWNGAVFGSARNV